MYLISSLKYQKIKKPKRGAQLGFLITQIFLRCQFAAFGFLNSVFRVEKFLYLKYPTILRKIHDV